MQFSLRHPSHASVKPEPVAFNEVLSAMVHEMVHAYTFAISCHCSVLYVFSRSRAMAYSSHWVRIYCHMQSVLRE